MSVFVLRWKSVAKCVAPLWPGKYYIICRLAVSLRLFSFPHFHEPECLCLSPCPRTDWWLFQDVPTLYPIILCLAKSVWTPVFSTQHLILNPWVLMWSWSVQCCCSSLNSSGKVFCTGCWNFAGGICWHSGWVLKVGYQVPVCELVWLGAS